MTFSSPIDLDGLNSALFSFRSKHNVHRRWWLMISHPHHHDRQWDGWGFDSQQLMLQQVLSSKGEHDLTVKCMPCIYLMGRREEGWINEWMRLLSIKSLLHVRVIVLIVLVVCDVRGRWSTRDEKRHPTLRDKHRLAKCLMPHEAHPSNQTTPGNLLLSPSTLSSLTASHPLHPPP